MTMEVTGSTAGPPHPLEGLMSQNGVTFQDVTSGRAANNTIHGSGNQADGPGGNGNGTGVLLFNADNVTLTENEFVGERTDIGDFRQRGKHGKHHQLQPCHADKVPMWTVTPPALGSPSSPLGSLPARRR